MFNRSFSTQAIILKRFNHGEADRILTLFTDKHGKITVIAKGVRKPQSRKRGHIELFNHIKAHIVNGKSLGIITEVETINSFYLPQTGHADSTTNKLELKTILTAYQFVELIDRLIPENQAHPEVFDLLQNSLHSLTTNKNLQISPLNSYFKHRLIRHLGFWPSDHTTPVDIDLLINNILEKPLKTTSFINNLRP